MGLAIREVQTPRTSRLVYGGQTVEISAQVVDDSQNIVLIDNGVTAWISLFDPSGNAVLEDQPMSRIASGVYSRLYDVPTTGPAGNWLSSLTMFYGDRFARIERTFVFKVLRAADLVDVSYLVIYDLNDVPWYWYINTAGELVSSPTIPSIFFKDMVSLSSGSPYWIEIDDDNDITWYVYPNALGEVTIAGEAPPNGTGVVGSYTWKAENTFNYILEVNIIGELTPVRS